ncbi:rhodanese-related sulfurtransferase [Actinoplanes campanulatus]|uniref:Rhodanese-related sulfurtransferase n=1 Tax=Actinoplanes campanulatus TaxID=113559 RepID=A0A7W5AKT2_9ACTN|nr:rhodanese-like domain-containing protein [Actinoplanes campanulatus]MBB3097912.1 rhodanese-related sulfurtransferase [Actinoplanes campanulatus]GGN22710.1 hypothetical protein GCM10010109_37420 [Actinoplanes campanulatus]GID34601.1 hypothetical protein Aca09nite_11070 [Actinoplanes campanulatus]
MTDTATSAPPHTGSRVLGVAPADQAEALDFFRRRLRCETDPYDVHHDIEAGETGLVVLDVRRREAYEAGHVAGARSLPHQLMTPDVLAGLDPEKVYVTYGWGPGCNGGVRAAIALSEYGLRVKEMMGGLEYWQRQGYPIARSTP